MGSLFELELGQKWRYVALKTCICKVVSSEKTLGITRFRRDMYFSDTKPSSMIICVELPTRQLYMMCLVWVLLHLTPQLPSIIVSCTYPHHVWINSSLEVCHYFLMTTFSCQIMGSSLMEVMQQIFKNKATQI